LKCLRLTPPCQCTVPQFFTRSDDRCWIAPEPSQLQPIRPTRQTQRAKGWWAQRGSGAGSEPRSQPWQAQGTHNTDAPIRIIAAFSLRFRCAHSDDCAFHVKNRYRISPGGWGRSFTSSNSNATSHRCAGDGARGCRIPFSQKGLRASQAGAGCTGGDRTHRKSLTSRRLLFAQDKTVAVALQKYVLALTLARPGWRARNQARRSTYRSSGTPGRYRPERPARRCSRPTWQPWLCLGRPVLRASGFGPSDNASYRA